MADAQAFIIFCENTRDELGNKISIMGMLGPEMIFEGPAEFTPITIAVLCRFFSADSVECELQVNIIPAEDDLAPPAPLVHRQQLHSPEGRDLWTAQLVGTFPILSVHHGMKLQVDFSAGTLRTSASLAMVVPAAPSVAAAN